MSIGLGGEGEAPDEPRRREEALRKSVAHTAFSSAGASPSLNWRLLAPGRPILTGVWLVCYFPRCRYSYRPFSGLAVMSLATPSFALSREVCELRDRIVRHMCSRVDATEMSDAPFPHISLVGFFPDDVYQRMQDSLPARDAYEPFGYDRFQTDTGQSNRRRFQLTDEWIDRLSGSPRTLWYAVREALGSNQLKCVVYDKLSPGLAYRFGIPREEAYALPGFALPELFHETDGYSIKPHPDTRKKIVTMQISLAESVEQRELGTEFYRRSLDPRSWVREPRGFEIAKRMPFVPNAVYAFSVLNTLRLKSWHGRTSIPSAAGERNSLLNIWYQDAAQGNPDMVERQAAERPVRPQAILAKAA